MDAPPRPVPVGSPPWSEHKTFQRLSSRQLNDVAHQNVLSYTLFFCNRKEKRRLKQKNNTVVARKVERKARKRKKRHQLWVHRNVLTNLQNFGVARAHTNLQEEAYTKRQRIRWKKAPNFFAGWSIICFYSIPLCGTAYFTLKDLHHLKDVLRVLKKR